MPRSRSPTPPAKLSERTEGEATAGTNLYIANLAYQTTDQELQDYFAKYGKILSCKVIRDPTDSSSRGFGFVTFERSEDAEKVMDTGEALELGGRTIRLERARRNKPYVPTPGRYLGTSQRRDRDGRQSPDRYRRRGSRSPRRRDSRSPSPPRRNRSPRRPRSPKRSRSPRRSPRR